MYNLTQGRSGCAEGSSIDIFYNLEIFHLQLQVEWECFTICLHCRSFLSFLIKDEDTTYSVQSKKGVIFLVFIVQIPQQIFKTLETLDIQFKVGDILCLCSRPLCCRFLNRYLLRVDITDSYESRRGIINYVFVPQVPQGKPFEIHDIRIKLFVPQC